MNNPGGPGSPTCPRTRPWTGCWGVWDRCCVGRSTKKRARRRRATLSRTRPSSVACARLTAGEEAAAPATPARRGRWPTRGGVALRVGLAAAALAVVILMAVAVVEVGVIAALTTALALVAVAVVLVVRARLGQ